MRRWTPLFGLALGMLVLGLGDQRAGSLVARHDKLAHALGLALLAVLLRRALPSWRGRRVAAACVLAALALEGLQAFVPGRTPSLGDVLAGLAGVGLALALLPGRSVRAGGMEGRQE